MSQVVGPIAVPGDEVAMVPFSTTRPEGDLFKVLPVVYGDAEEPGWAAVWRQDGDEVLDRVIPATKEEGP